MTHTAEEVQELSRLLSLYIKRLLLVLRKNKYKFDLCDKKFVKMHKHGFSIQTKKTFDWHEVGIVFCNSKLLDCELGLITEYIFSTRSVLQFLEIPLKYTVTVDKNDWVKTMHLYNFVQAYLLSADSIYFNSAIFKNTFKEFLNRFKKEITIQFICPLKGLEIKSGKIDLGDSMILRRPLQSEYDRWLNSSVDGDFSAPDGGVLSSKCVLEYRVLANSSKHITFSVDYLKVIAKKLIPIQYFTKSKIQPFFVEEFHPDTLRNQVHTQGWHSRYNTRLLNYFTLNKNEITNLKKFLFKYYKNQKIHLSIEMYVLALNATMARDAFIYLWIGIESLIVQSSEDISHKAAFRTALILGKDAQQRLEIFNTLKKSYKVRSYFVHGETKKLSKDINYSKLVKITAWCLNGLIEIYLKKPFDTSTLDDSILKRGIKF